MRPKDIHFLIVSSDKITLYPWQTYVLDVHPFNPRIAMSAGYDGKTIVWDVSFWVPFSLSFEAFLFLTFSWGFCFIWCYLILDLGRHANSDIWNFSFQTGGWEVFIVSSYCKSCQIDPHMLDFFVIQCSHLCESILL